MFQRITVVLRHRETLPEEGPMSAELRVFDRADVEVSTEGVYATVERPDLGEQVEEQFFFPHHAVIEVRATIHQDSGD